MEIKFDAGSSLIDVVSRWDFQGALAVGDQVRVRVLSVQDNLVIISLHGQEILVSTELPFEPGMNVNLIYEGINAEGKHSFRLAERQGAVQTPLVRLAHEVFGQFGIEPTPELISRLETYLKLDAARFDAGTPDLTAQTHAGVNDPPRAGKGTPIEDRPDPGAGRRETGRQKRLERQSVEQFALLAKSGIPLNNTNLRIWHQFWKTPVLEAVFSELLTMAEKDGGHLDQDMMQLINSLFVQIDPADPQSLKQQLVAKWIKPQKEAGEPGIDDTTDSPEKAAEARTGILPKNLETALVRLVQQHAALQAVNAASRRFCSQSQPLLLLIPVAHGENTFLVEMLIEDQRQHWKGLSVKQHQNLRLTVTIPTFSLGRVIAVITMQRQQFFLELVSDSQETVNLIRKHLDSSELQDVFQSVSVRQRQLEPLQPKNQLIAQIKQQIDPQIDLRI